MGVFCIPPADKYRPIMVDMMKKDISILIETKKKLVKILHNQALLGHEFIYLGDIFISRPMEELRKIIADYTLGKIEEPEDRDISKVKVYTNIDIWRRARVIDQFLSDCNVEFFEKGYINIDKETEWDMEIIHIRGFDFNIRDGKLMIFIPKEDNEK